MKIDIDKLNKKVPYPEPSEDFFKSMQDKVIANVVVKNKEIKKTRVFALNFKWMAAAAIVLIAGIAAFITNENEKPNRFADSNNMIDRVYETGEVKSSKDSQFIETRKEIENDILVDYRSKNQNKNSLVSNDKSKNDSKENLNSTKTNSMLSEADKVLVAFTADQLSDIDKNIEQDVYLDLYY